MAWVLPCCVVGQLTTRGRGTRCEAQIFEVDPSHLVDTQFQRGSQNLDLSAVRSTPGHLIPQGGLLRPPEHACVGHDDRRDAGYCTAVNSAASWSWTSLWCVQEPPCSPCSPCSLQYEGGWRKQAVPVQVMSLMAACVGPGLRGDGVQGRWVEENIEAMDEEEPKCQQSKGGGEMANTSARSCQKTRDVWKEDTDM